METRGMVGQGAGGRVAEWDIRPGRLQPVGDT